MVLHLAWLFVVGEAQRMGKPLVNVDPSLVTEATPAGAFWDELPCARTAHVFLRRLSPAARRPILAIRSAEKTTHRPLCAFALCVARSLDAAVLG